MSTTFETQHPRGAAGRFVDKTYAEAEGGTDALITPGQSQRDRIADLLTRDGIATSRRPLADQWPYDTAVVFTRHDRELMIPWKDHPEATDEPVDVLVAAIDESRDLGSFEEWAAEQVEHLGEPGDYADSGSYFEAIEEHEQSTIAAQEQYDDAVALREQLQSFFGQRWSDYSDDPGW